VVGVVDGDKQDIVPTTLENEHTRSFSRAVEVVGLVVGCIKKGNSFRKWKIDAWLQQIVKTPHRAERTMSWRS